MGFGVRVSGRGLLVGLALAISVTGLRGAAPDDDPATVGATRLLRQPTVSATHIAFAYASNIWIVERAGGTARRVTSFQGQASHPQLSPDGRTLAFSAEYAGNADVYIVPVDRRGADAPHVAPRRRSGSGLDARRRARALHVDAGHGGAHPDRALLDGGRGRRPRVAAGAAARLSGQALARRAAHRLPHEQLVGRGAPQLPRRPEQADLDRRSHEPRTGLAAVDRLEGHRSGVGGRVGLLPLGSRRRRQCLGVRAGNQAAHAGHTLHRLRRQIARRWRRRGGLRAGRLRPRTRPRNRQGRGRAHPRGRRLPVDDDALGRRHQPHRQHRSVAHRQAGGRRGPRRDLHRAGRQGRRAQSHGLERRRPNASRPGRPTAATCPTSAMPRASTGWSSRPRTDSRRRGRSRSTSRRATTRRRGRPTAPSCSTATPT